MVVLGLVPKISALVEAVPTVVLGGAGMVMFGMVAVAGIRILAPASTTSGHGTTSSSSRRLGFGMIPVVAPGFFHQHRRRCSR